LCETRAGEHGSLGDSYDCKPGKARYGWTKGEAVFMRRGKEKIIAYCPKCKKQTAWLYINGVNPFWLCLVCATRAEALRTDPPARRKELVAKVEETTAAAHETLARTHQVLDQTRTLLHELDEARQLHRAIAEHRTEQHRQSGSAPSPPPAQAPASPPAPLPIHDYVRLTSRA
jgi:hypothetical protein